MTWPGLVACGAIAGGLAFAISLEPPMGNVSGKVSTSTGRPASGARVVLLKQNQPATAEWARTRVGRDGRFAVRSVPVGDYKMLVMLGQERREAQIKIEEATLSQTTIKLNAPPIKPRPIIHPAPDPVKVRQRTRDILRSRFMLNRDLLNIIRENDVSGLPLPLVLAQAGAESSFRPQLSGKLDEIGLFQLRPSTARDQEYGPFTEVSIMEAATNTRLATRHLGRLRRIFKSDRTALAAYNQGEGRTAREGLYPIAQLYADAIIMAAYHEDFKARVLQLDPSLASHWKR